MSLKLPGIKGLVSSSQRKRRFKKDLTADMISPPMGDFRHTMHVGRGGDVFGDTSFLSNHGGTGNGAVADPVDSPSLKTAGFFSRTLRHVRKTPTPQRAVPPDSSPPPPAVSPIIKNAISLPRLDADAPNGRLQRELFPSSPRSPEDFTCTYGVESGFATLPRSGTYRSDFRRSSVPDDSILPLLHCDSMTSFTVDLGPSLMSEVFGVIDSPDGGRHSWVDEEKREEEEEKEPCPPSGHATFPASTPVAGSLLREDLNMRGFGSRGREWEELEGDPPRRAIPDVLMGSTARAEPGMEAVRFKMAANVLARHYGSGGLSKGTQETVDWDKRQFSPDTVDSTGCAKRRGPCAYPEEEDEIKV
ncbi:cdc42 effector protein 1 [Conger conger]|uniref:cdc42 effector protein 1 n=1 Tax=Conger conger TaxID=82655 RepID=UPI002A5A98D0|nr:cdc42 effector protein 1 [Conger conger]